MSTFIVQSRKLLDLYSKVRREANVAVGDQFIEQLREIRHIAIDSACGKHRSQFDRFLRLLSLRVTNAYSLLGMGFQPACQIGVGSPDRSSKTDSPFKFTRCFNRYPDLTNKRISEGGKRLEGQFPMPRPGHPIVTIVTAVYDNDNTFQRCIDSVRSQTYKEIEYIVIDGGSPESTQKVIQNNKQHIDYFVSEPDLGIYAAMNKGISLANGEYICLLNSDDTYEPEFVEKAVACAMSKKERSDIVYTDYRAGKNILRSNTISSALLFGHLNVCHNTFLVHRNCYDRIGPYDESFRIVSDAIWIRKAILSDSVFTRLPETLFTLSEGGLSSGGSESLRRLFISEMSESYRLNFPQISKEHAEELYLFRFNKNRAGKLLEIAKQYRNHPRIITSLKGYVEHCLKDRSNFQLGKNETTAISQCIELINFFDLNLRCLQLETGHGPLSNILDRIEQTISRRKPSAKRLVLHFVTVFSSPSETFIYDLVRRLDSINEYDNFVLFEHEMLSDERPFSKSIQVYWDHFPDLVGAHIYKYIVDRLQPDVLIGHFALNEWKWSQRTKALKLSLPTISMCHGVDVFTTRTNAAYRKYISEDFVNRSNTVFTVVSDYLKRELQDAGVPDSKITLIPNAVNSVFFDNRKSENYFDQSRPLKILSVGRLIGLKGHKYLLKALGVFRDNNSTEFNLTIIYGNGKELLKPLSKLCLELGLEELVHFVPFVDLAANPNFYTEFDLFIHPSTYSSDEMSRSESFGIAPLEAIIAGLPVITTDAGGLPEVIGEESDFAKIVPHANANAITSAIEQLIYDGKAFSDNFSYASDRLQTYSSERQLALLTKLVDSMVSPLKAAMFSTSTIQGAGYAAYRLLRGLQETSIEARLFTTIGAHATDPNVKVLSHPSGNPRAWKEMQFEPKPGLTISSLNQQHLSNDYLEGLVEDFDIINLHWHARFLSIENVIALTHTPKPVVMTIRDMMPITGGCHYFHGCVNWKSDCSYCPQFPVGMKHIPAEILYEKRTGINFENLTIVALSKHSRKIFEKAPFFKNCRIEIIPNSIETNVFKPYGQESARAELGLPTNRKVIGYAPSFSSEVKGYQEFTEALKLLSERYGEQKPLIMLMGNETPATREIHLEKHVLGYIHDNEQLAKAYSAADVVVVPSLEETFSNTTAEAISCGTPVVGFETGAIPELAIQGKTGYTARLGDVSDLAHGIKLVLDGPNLQTKCRQLAVNLLSFEKQALSYEALFTELVERSRHMRRYSRP